MGEDERRPGPNPFSRDETGEPEEFSPGEIPEEARQKERELRQLEDQRMQELGEQSPARRQSIEEGISGAFEKLLQPYFEGSELEEYSDQFKSTLTAVVPVANIRRSDIPRYLTLILFFNFNGKYFDLITLWWLEKGLRIPGYATHSFRMTFEMQLTRAIQGFERKMQISSRQVVSPEKIKEGQKEEGGFLSRIFGGK